MNPEEWPTKDKHQILQYFYTADLVICCLYVILKYVVNIDIPFTFFQLFGVLLLIDAVWMILSGHVVGYEEWRRWSRRMQEAQFITGTPARIIAIVLFVLAFIFVFYS